MQSDEKLLQEYSLGQEYALALHEHIWQIGSILIAAALATFVLVAKPDPVTVTSLLISILCATVSTILLVIWYLIKRRFSVFIQISYYRLQEIESELGMWRNRYIHYLDNPSTVKLTELPESDKKRLRSLERDFGKKHFKLRATTLEKILTAVVPLVWCSWIAYQVIVLFF